jgi:hypothetical protein
MKTIHQLRKEGYKIRVAHYRVSNHTSIKKFHLINSSLVKGDCYYSRGGLTVVQVRHLDGRETEGRARCSIHDNYYRKGGVELALYRALQEKERLDLLNPAVELEDLYTGNLPKPISIAS